MNLNPVIYAYIAVLTISFSFMAWVAIRGTLRINAKILREMTERHEAEMAFQRKMHASIMAKMERYEPLTPEESEYLRKAIAEFFGSRTGQNVMRRLEGVAR